MSSVYSNLRGQVTLLTCVCFVLSLGTFSIIVENFNRKHTIKYDVIDKYSVWLKQNGINGVLVNGTMSEGTCLSTVERMRVTEEWVRSWQLVLWFSKKKKRISGACTRSMFFFYFNTPGTTPAQVLIYCIVGIVINAWVCVALASVNWCNDWRNSVCIFIGKSMSSPSIELHDSSWWYIRGRSSWISRSCWAPRRGCRSYTARPILQATYRRRFGALYKGGGAVLSDAANLVLSPASFHRRTM